ncbi:MAG: GNAT family N-acetyltransferase [Phycisphaerae bacterium]|nr:GNAT family N-acetyltransferase [Phycisphaerae bacterium]
MGPSTEPTIRQATARDAPLLNHIIRGAYLDVARRFDLTPENCPTHPSNCTEAWVESAVQKGVRFYVAQRGETACGCVGLDKIRHDLCYIERLGVLPEFRSRGIGTALMRHALDQARALGADCVEIGIIADHAELKDWYTRLGFLVKQEHVSIEHLPFTVTFMCLRFGECPARRS